MVGKNNGNGKDSTFPKKLISKSGHNELSKVLDPYDSKMEVNMIRKSKRIAIVLGIHVRPSLHSSLKTLCSTLFVFTGLMSFFWSSILAFPEFAIFTQAWEVGFVCFLLIIKFQGVRLLS